MSRVFILIVIFFAACTTERMTTIEQLMEDLSAAENASQREQHIEHFMEQVRRTGTPLIENDTTVIYLYQGANKRVRILGDITQWADNIEMENIPRTDLYYYRGIHPAEARLEYQLIIDDDPPIADPLCPYKVLNGLGSHSELAMPGYTYHPALESVRDGTTGDYARVTQHLLSSGIMGYATDIYVYTPPEYDSLNTHHPAIYVLDGQDYIEYAHAPAVLDHLIESGELEPVIAVFIAPPNRHAMAIPNRSTEYGMNPDYARFMADEVVPFVEKHYRSLALPSARLVAGPSYAGLASAYIALHHSNVFGLAYSQSGYFSFRSNALVEAYRHAPRKPIRLYVDIGLYEQMVGLGWLPDDAINFLKANRQFKEVLTEKGYDFIYQEYPEGHTWGNWRAHLIDALSHFFPADIQSEQTP